MAENGSISPQWHRTTCGQQGRMLAEMKNPGSWREHTGEGDSLPKFCS